MRISPVWVMGLMGVGSAIAVFATRPATQSMDWQDATTIPKPLLEQVVRDNVTPGFKLDATQMQVWTIQLAGQAKPLYLIDTRIADLAEVPSQNPLCGAMGCAFFGYIPVQDHYQQVLTLYLQPDLPPDIPLFEITQTLQQNLPILQVNQLDGEQIQQYTLTFSGQHYETVATQLFPHRYE